MVVKWSLWLEVPAPQLRIIHSNRRSAFCRDEQFLVHSLGVDSSTTMAHCAGCHTVMVQKIEKSQSLFLNKTETPNTCTNLPYLHRRTDGHLVGRLVSFLFSHLHTHVQPALRVPWTFWSRLHQAVFQKCVAMFCFAFLFSVFFMFFHDVC